MQGYRASFMGPDGHIKGRVVDLMCENDHVAKEKKNNSSTITTSSSWLLDRRIVKLRRDEARSRSAQHS
jgi:hypothetical protein